MNNICTLCPNKCKVNKTEQKGFCGTDDKIFIAKYYLHKFEEPIISGTNGSGTVFFCGCSLKCVFCQNFELSRSLRGKEFSVEQLADIFRFLEDQGAHNINLVSPTHYSNKIIDALKIYRPKIPLLYNTHGYECIENLNTLNDFVDIYLPDCKFYSPEISQKYCGKKDYFEVASKAIEFMANSKPLKFDDNGLIKSGVVVRHLVLPQNVSDSKKILDWFNGIKDKAFIDVMSQYTPFGDVESFPELKRKLTKREYDSVIDYAISLGIENMFYQEQQSASEKYIPNWDF